MNTTEEKLHWRPTFIDVLLVMLVVIYFVFSAQPGLTDLATLYATLDRFMVTPDIIELWRRPWWWALGSLLCAPFLHVDPFHLAFNGFWLWLIARRAERAIGWENSVLFTLSAGIIGSCGELAVGMWPALGATSIVYAYLGLLLGGWRARPIMAAGLRHVQVRVLYLFLIFLWLNTVYLRLWPTTVAGPLLAMAFGYLLARLLLARRFPAWSAFGIACIAFICVCSVTHASWLPQWRYSRALTLLESGRVDEGKQALLELSNPNPLLPDDAIRLQAMNALAWILATAPAAEWRDGEQAIQLARRANALSLWREPSLIDTLAAAYAEADQWSRAEAVQRLALRELKYADEAGDAMNGLQGELERNLERIQRREKIRDHQMFGDVPNDSGHDNG